MASSPVKNMSLDVAEDLSPSSSLTGGSFKNSLQQFTYQTPSPSPLKRKSPAPGDLPSNKRITRSASTASLKATAAAKQPVFPPPVNLSPSPSKAGLRSVSTSSPSKTPPAKRRKSTGTLPASTSPTTNLLRDALEPGLHIMFVGVNPGIQTAATGFAYAHPSNRFYPLLHVSGITPVRCKPSEYYSMVARFGLGHTNVVTRPTRDASMLSKKEMEEGVAAIEEKVKKFRPGCVVMVGKSVWEAVERVWKREGKWSSKKPFKYGWQDAWIGRDTTWEGSRVFAATSTSGLAATVSWDEKVRIWKELGDWYKEQVNQTEAAAKTSNLSV